MRNSIGSSSLIDPVRPLRRRSSAGGAFLALVVVLVCAGCGSSGNSGALRDHLLSAAQLPHGWSVVAVPASERPTTNASCLSKLSANAHGWTYTSRTFVEGSSIPTVSEVLATGHNVNATWSRLARTLSNCHRVRIRLGKVTVTSTVRPLAFPKVGGSTSAFAWALSISGLRVGFDLVLFTTPHYGGYVTYSDLGAPQIANVEAFARAAVRRARTGAGGAITSSLAVASAPVEIAHTARGAVAYRTVGSGRPLVLIMGYASTMQEWDTRFVDALAQRYRVYIFDNAGIGGTSALPAPLTVDAMADQTSALISTLRLGRVDVLGWSMGTMVAQALAVRHPDQVSRLVLSASYPGNGSTVQPSQQAINALNSGDQAKVNAELFPADQMDAAKEFGVTLSSYPAAPPAPANVVAAQAAAIKAWWAGRDQSGRQADRITAPTLIADGSEDRLDPNVNDHLLQRLIPGSKLVLYPDAGHAFLFQDQASFVPLVESFLG